MRRILILSAAHYLFIAFFFLSYVPAHCQQGNFFREYEKNRQELQRKDSMGRAGKNEAVAELEKKFKTAEKDNLLLQQELALTQHREEIRMKNILLAAGTVCMILLVFIVILIYKNFRSRLSLYARQSATQRHQQEIENLHAMMAGAENEKLQLSYSLKEGIGNRLEHLKGELQQLKAQHKWLGDDTAFAEILQQVETALTEVALTAKNIDHDVVPAGGLVNALEKFCASIRQSTALDIRFIASGHLPPMPHQAELSVYRVVQELVHNILKHTNAAMVTVRLISFSDSFEMVVEDDSTAGAQDPQAASGGVGRKNIYDRVAMLNGTIISHPGDAGTMVKMIFPA